MRERDRHRVASRSVGRPLRMPPSQFKSVPSSSPFSCWFDSVESAVSSVCVCVCVCCLFFFLRTTEKPALQMGLCEGRGVRGDQESWKPQRGRKFVLKNKNNELRQDLTYLSLNSLLLWPGTKKSFPKRVSFGLEHSILGIYLVSIFLIMLTIWDGLNSAPLGRLGILGWLEDFMPVPTFSGDNICNLWFPQEYWFFNYWTTPCWNPTLAYGWLQISSYQHLAYDWGFWSLSSPASCLFSW